MKYIFIKVSRQVIKSLWICVLFLLVSCAKDIVEINGSIQGVVKDYNTGAFIANCQVSLLPGGKSVVTSYDGMFELSDLEPGNYTLSFSKAGYEEVSKSVNVVSSEISAVNITLKAKSPFATSSSNLDFGDLSNSMELYFYNNSDETTSFTISNVPTWASVSHASGSVSAGGNMSVMVSINRDAVSYGTYTQILSVAYKGKTNGTISITLQMQKIKVSAPTVNINDAAEETTQNSFVIQGELTATGGAEVTSYGHCWALTENPTTANNKTDNGATTSIGFFKSNVTELVPGSSYYVRAYATNQYGTSYSKQIVVTTQDVASNKWDGNVAKSFAKGHGTSVDPYVIETGGQLLLMKNYNDKYFKLANNIDLDNKNWIPFEFKGNLDGNGCIVSNLMVSRETDKQGLFSTLYGATVKNLIIKNVNIEAPSNSYIGVLSGCFKSGSGDVSIYNCHVIMNEKSQITGNKGVGGLIGYAEWQGSGGNLIIENSSVEYAGTVSDVINGDEYVGGIIGYCPVASTIKSCMVSANIKGVSYVGGICGYTNAATIISSKADVDLTVESQYAGGIAGQGYSIYSCYSQGTIKGSSSVQYIGGIVGFISWESIMSYSTITSSLSAFDGIAGRSDHTPSYCASISSSAKKGTNQGECKNITTFLRESYQSEYDEYWNYNKTWTWTGTIGEDQVRVSCPKLIWE